MTNEQTHATIIERRPGRVAPTVLAGCNDDLGIAAQSGLCMMITACPSIALELACEVAFRGNRDSGVMAVDCREPIAESTLAALCRGAHRITETPRAEPNVLLLQEVHGLTPQGQSILAAALEMWQTQQPHRQVIASSSLQMYDRLQGGTFDDRLFYRLNTISVEIRETQTSLVASL